MTVKMRLKPNLRTWLGWGTFGLSALVFSGSAAFANEADPYGLAPAKKQLDPTGVVGAVFPLHVRLGAMVSPRTKFIGGIDYTTKGLAPNLSTRIDADAIVSANFGGVNTLFPVTVDQIYSKGLVGGTQVYGGIGLGVYFGDVSRFGGKLLVGGDFGRRVGAEVALHFAGYGDALVTAQVRLRL